MKVNKYEATPFYEVVRCEECGGDVDVLVEECNYLTEPPQAKYKCRKCQKEYILSVENFPTIKWDIKK